MEYKDDIEMRPLPPNVTDLSQDIEDLLGGIERKISQLNSLYKKNLLPGFTDTSADDKEIDDLNYEITRDFQKVYNGIKECDEIGQDVRLFQNMKKNFAQRTQKLSGHFRKIQNNYIRYLKQDDFVESVDQVADDGNIENYSKAALQESSTVLESSGLENEFIQNREREIYKIAQGVLEISTIFKEMEAMVIDQGTVLDRIDYNLENAVVDLKKSDKELLKGSSYQKKTTKCKIILLLSLVVFGLAIIVLNKPSGGTPASHSGNDVPSRPAINDDKEDQ